jgi:hypothetical protein
LGRYEHARAWRARARARHRTTDFPDIDRRKKIPPAFTTIVRAGVLRVRFCA